MWSTVGYLRAMFDEPLPVPPIAEKLVHSFDTTDMDSAPVDFGRNGQAGVR